jgi:uncharacterized membrane-anchored protein
MDGPGFAGVIAVSIPIVVTLVIGLVFVTFFYFRSRERQMLIDKGLDAQSIKEYFAKKHDPYTLMKWGIIILTFGVGLGFGIMLEESTDQGFWIVLLMFALTGIGFIIANVVSQKLLKKNQ